MKKRLISACLALVMVLSLLPVSVYAEEKYDFYFTNFQELKEKLALENPEDWVEACYTGADPLIIEEDFTLYDVYFGTPNDNPIDMIIPEGVTLTNHYSKNGFGTLTVDGTLINNITIFIYNELEINGHLILNSNIILEDGCVDSGTGSIEYGKHGFIERIYYVYDDLTELQDVLQLAAADKGPNVSYSVRFDGEDVVLNGDFYVPRNTGLILPYDESTTIPQGSSLTIDGHMSINGPLTVEGALINNNYGISIHHYFDSRLHISDTGSYEGNGEISIYELNQSKLEDVIIGLDFSMFDIEYWYGGEEYVDCYLTPKSDIAPGDANGDGNINNVDAMQVLQAAVGLLDQSKINYNACDVNGDGSVNNVDAMMILQFAVGLLTEFPGAKA